MTDVRALAAETPDSRNRAIDAFRAIAIIFVVLGHWLGAAVWTGSDGALMFNNILALDDATHWITWIVQVMPVFFIVGGYAHWRSRVSSSRKSITSADWIGGRSRRLMTPVGPFILFLTLLIAVTLALDVDVEIVRGGSWNAVVPLWFLGVYLLIVAATPLTTRAWTRWGWKSVAVGMVAAFGIDGLRAAFGADWIGWFNYLVVWATVHQFGYSWATEPRPPARKKLAVLIAVGVAALLVLTVLGPYPVSMVAVPGAPQNNTLPPTAMMALMGVVQYGLMRLFEPAAERTMNRARPWLAVVGLHTVIITVYIWHLTALALVVLAGYGLGIGFGIEPLTTAWWLTRLPWAAVLTIALTALVLVFGRFEHAVRRSGMSPVWLLTIGLASFIGAIGVATTSGLVNESGQLLWLVIGLFAIGLGAVGAWPTLERS